MTTTTTATTARATVTLSRAKAVPGQRFDHVFFPSMALLMLVTVFIGFARTYYLAGLFRAPLPSPIIHVHGALFSGWILVLVAQASLVAAGRVNLHRRLGIAAFVLACLMVIVGLWAATDSLVREAAAERRDPKAFYIVPLSAMLVFATCTAFAFRNRFNPPAHKRLILIATSALLVAALARWPIALFYRQLATATLGSHAFIVLIALYDLWSIRRIHRATLWGGAFLIVVDQVRVPISHTAAWLAFAGWVQALAR